MRSCTAVKRSILVYDIEYGCSYMRDIAGLTCCAVSLNDNMKTGFVLSGYIPLPLRDTNYKTCFHKSFFSWRAETVYGSV